MSARPTPRVLDSALRDAAVRDAAEAYGVALVLETSRELAEDMGTDARGLAYREVYTAIERSAYTAAVNQLVQTWTLQESAGAGELDAHERLILIGNLGVAHAWRGRSIDASGAPRGQVSLVEPRRAQRYFDWARDLLPEDDRAAFFSVLEENAEVLGSRTEALRELITTEFDAQQARWEVKPIGAAVTRSSLAFMNDWPTSLTVVEPVPGTFAANLRHMANSPSPDVTARRILAAVGAVAATPPYEPSNWGRVPFSRIGPGTRAYQGVPRTVGAAAQPDGRAMPAKAGDDVAKAAAEPRR